MNDIGQAAAIVSRRAVSRAGWIRLGRSRWSACSHRAICVAAGVLLGGAAVPAWAQQGPNQQDPRITQPSILPAQSLSPFATGLGMIAPTGSALDESVQQRPRPEFAPIGMQLDDAITEVGQLLVDRKDRDFDHPQREATGSFQLYPKFETSVGYDDNLYRKDTNTSADEIFTFAPSLLLQSEWANHALYFSTGALAAEHVENTSENYLNYYVGTGGRLDIEEDEFINGNLRFGQEHEQRDSPDDLGLPEPTPYRTYAGDLSYTKRGSAIYDRVAFNFLRSDYDDVGTVNNDDRDRNEYTLSWRVGWEDVPGMVYYLEPSVNTRVYDDEVDDTGLRRSSKGWQLLAGINWDVSGVTYAEFGVGYMSQDYDDALLPTVSGWSMNSKLLWNTTELVTMTAEAQRSIDETTQVDASGILATRASFTVDYEALYNLILDAKVSWRNDEYQGNSRNDDTWIYSVGARYLMTENYYSLLRFSHDVRESNQTGNGYTDNRIVLTFGVQL
ncbi:MAG TPA: outer membrane beta-barrel protein [Alphaproteobacteria bacterium]